MRRHSWWARQNNASRRLLEREGAGDNEIGRVVSFSPAGPSGGTISVDIGGGRVVQMDGGGSSYHPGTAVRVTRAMRGSSREVAGVASRRFQPNNSAQSFTYDPAGLLER